MAGGKGSRLHPYSALFPKPLMPLGDKPVLEILLHQLRVAGVTEVILAVNHLRHLLEAFFGDGSRFGLSISYSVEDRPLGTAGPVGLVLDRLGEDFFLTNGDLLTTLDMGAMLADHRARRADTTIGAYRRELRSEFGLLEVDETMRMVGYKEKPAYQHLVSMGIYALRRDAVRPFVVRGEPLDMPALMQAMQRAGLRVFCHSQDCLWLDIGRPEDFAADRGAEPVISAILRETEGDLELVATPGVSEAAALAAALPRATGELLWIPPAGTTPDADMMHRAGQELAASDAGALLSPILGLIAPTRLLARLLAGPGVPVPNAHPTRQSLLAALAADLSTADFTVRAPAAEMAATLTPVLLSLISGRCGSTLMMQLLATSPEVAMDRVAPYENNYLTYLNTLAGHIALPGGIEAAPPGADFSMVGALPFSR